MEWIPSTPDGQVSRVDLHCHSAASEVSRLGVQRAVGLPECATPPEEVYELAKRRGMDFVTITDHDTIDGVLSIADRADVFVSEELTARFRGERQAVHVLCFEITGADHEWLQRSAHDVEACAEYMHERGLTAALAHPYYQVAAPLTARHRRRLAELFDVWEVRNGARAPELNRPAATYVATRDGIGIAGSDDHAGTDIGRTFTETPAAATPAEFFAHVRAGRAGACGAQGSAAKWAHAAIALAARSLAPRARGQDAARPDPARVLALMKRLLGEADAREGATQLDFEPADARCLLRAWLVAVGLGEIDEAGLIALMQEDGFSHAALYRRACRAHERGLRAAVEAALAAVDGDADLPAAAQGLFDASLAAIPYAPAAAFLASERQKIAAIPGRHDDGEPARVAIVADGIGATHGVSRTLEEIRERGVPGFEIEVVGTDADVDRRLSSAAEFEVPFYPGLQIGVPTLPSTVQALTDGHFDLIHVCAPGPAGVTAALLARALRRPLVGSYHTELAAYTSLRSGDERLATAMAMTVAAFYSACDVLLSPSAASDAMLASIGITGERVMRWDRGVDTARFDPSLRDEDLLPGEVTVLYCGRITREKGVGLLADAFLRARERDARLHLVLAGDGPERGRLAARLGEHATFLGWQHGADLARVYASADAFLFPSATDTFGQVILEAQASGLPVVAVAEGGPLSLIEDRVSGRLCPADGRALSEALLEVLGAPLLRERITAAALRAARARTWEATMELLADAYRRALAGGASGDGSEDDAARAA
ncbi:MAG TPA: glycosyltransferase [Solirubrobacteraceae bacterium]|nr:glycosyltransferase [Solirubrobacteraceae bacterium]